VTVAELIERLRAFDGNLPVVYEDYEEGSIFATEVMLTGASAELREPGKVMIR
jgi:hypothetical protein